MGDEVRIVSGAVLTCGGTGGHVYPAIAIARELMARHPGARVSFVGRPDSYEWRTLTREGFDVDTVRVGRLAGQGIATRLRTLAELPLSVLRAWRVLRRRAPAVVIGTGGFVSGPTMLAAFLRRTPTVVQEQNAVAGLTNRALWKIADRVALAHEPPGGASGRFHVTGNPVRPEFFAIPEHASEEPFTLLVLGGSQGARTLNEATLDAAQRLGHLADRLRIVLQCGPRWEDELAERAAAVPVPVELLGYLHDVPARLAECSLACCRAGASTVAELCAAGRPALLVPYPHAAGDHQTANARALVATGAGWLLPDGELTGESLAERIASLVTDRERLATAASRARALGRPRAAASVVDLVDEIARRPERSPAKEAA
jgi:UDP-N-acetylglucosamine--N-acetylmuramyl-(pentapeptide) pyrophosphoryl-undecaprenol N-acetylglucosamine transferase